MTTTTDTQESPAIAPQPSLARLKLELAICDHIEAIERHKAAIRFLELVRYLREGNAA